MSLTEHNPRLLRRVVALIVGGGYRCTQFQITANTCPTT